MSKTLSVFLANSIKLGCLQEKSSFSSAKRNRLFLQNSFYQTLRKKSALQSG